MNNAKSNTFRVLTYNLWCHRLVGGRYSARRLHTFASWLLHDSTPLYDIICLQEVFVCNPWLLLHYGSGQRANLIEIVKTKYPYNCTAHAPWFSVQDSGCLILSAHELEPCQQESFNGYSLSELATHKGFMCCKTIIANQELIIINTHLHAGMPTSAAIRRRQLQQINDHITTYHTGHRVILCGDLNIDCSSREYRHMMKTLSVNQLIDSTPDAAATYLRLVRLDYILTNQYFSSTLFRVISADAENQDDLQLMVSDHEGLEATLKFTNVEPPTALITRVLRPKKFRTARLKGLMIFLLTGMMSAILYYYLYRSQTDSYH